MKTGLVRVGYAPITAQTETATTYGEVKYFATVEAGGREYKATPVGTVKEIYANSQPVYQAEINGGYDIELTLIDIIDDIEEDWYDFDSYSNGMLEKAKDTEKPRFALILSDNDTSATGKTEIFYNCVCTSRPDITGKTAEKGNWDDQFPVYKISATPRPKDGYVRFVKSGTAELTTVPEPTNTTTP